MAASKRDSVVIIPSETKEEVYLIDNFEINLDKLNIYRDKNVYILGTRKALSAVKFLFGKAKVYIFSQWEFERHFCDPKTILKSFQSGRLIEYFPINWENLILLERKGLENPLIKVLDWFNVDHDYCHELILRIIDPRLFINGAYPAFSSEHCRNFLRGCGLTYNIFEHTVNLDRIRLVEVDTFKLPTPVLAMYCWSKNNFEFISKFRSNGSIFYPRENPQCELESIQNYFWRYYFNNAIEFNKVDLKALFKTTKRFLILLFRLWGHYIETFHLESNFKCCNFEPEKFFRYKCEANAFSEYLAECTEMWKEVMVK